MSSSESIRAVLLLQSGALGDCVLQLRIAEAMRQALPAARITWLGRDDWLALAQRCASVDDALGLDALAAHRLFQPGLQTDADLADRLGRFDLIVNGLTGPASPVMDRLRRFARRAAVSYDPKPQPHATQHMVRQWLGQIAAQLAVALPALADDIERYGAALEDQAGSLLQPRLDDRMQAAERLHAAGLDPDAGPRRLLLLHPGSGGLHKCYPIEQYLRLSRILSQHRLQPLMLLGPAELDRWAEQLSRLVRHSTLIADPPLPLLAGLMSLAGGYLGNDSGPTHMAAAAGTPTLALFGPTNPRLWRPLGQQVAALQSNTCQDGWSDLPAKTVATQSDLAFRS